MSQRIIPTQSPRNAIPYRAIPTRRGSIYGGSITPYSWQEYGVILDCVYEMADDIGTGNGVTPFQAIVTVLHDEGWRVLPTHQKAIAVLLA